MSKELEALKNLTEYLTGDYRDCFEKLSIIENALKRLEKIETTTHSVLREDISKNLKAFEIIKKYPKCSLAYLINYECAKRKGYSVGSLDINDIPYTQEEYDIVIQELEELVEERLKRF